MRSRRISAVVASLSLLAVPACTGTADGGLRVEVLVGTVEVSGAEAGFERVTGNVQLEEGSRVRTGPDSAAVVRLSGRMVELGEETEVALSEGLRLERGSILAQGSLIIGVVEADVATSGVVRMERDLSLRIGAYEGSARIAGASDAVEVDRYRETTLSQGVTPRRTRPLRVSAEDRWDRRLLADQLELQRWIAAFIAGLGDDAAIAATARDQMGTPRVPATSLAVGLSDPDLWVATAIAAASPGLFAENIGPAVTLRAELAEWAVVAAVLGADDDEVRRLIGTGLDRARNRPSPRVRPSVTPPPGSGQAPDRTPRPPAPTATPGPAPTPPPDPCPDCNTVERILCSLFGTCSRLPVP